MTIKTVALICIGPCNLNKLQEGVTAVDQLVQVNDRIVTMTAAIIFVTEIKLPC